MIPKLSLVIPSSHGHDQLEKLFCEILSQRTLPNEIIVVDSSISSGHCPILIRDLCNGRGIDLIYVARDKCLPGAARNFALERATGEWIAFLDIRTHPVGDWLGLQLEFISKNCLAGSWGMSIFEAESEFSALVRDGIYGQYPIRHLPGSVLHRNLIRRIGYFIPKIRAGEDGDWIERAVLLGEAVTTPPFVTTRYLGLLNTSGRELVLKWFSYYGSTRTMPFHLPQKFFLAWAGYSLLILLAFNWNRFFASWDIGSPFYISNVTKLSALLPFVAYFAYRGLYLPLRRGVLLSNLLPFRFVRIGIVCLVLDLVKSYALLVPRFRNGS